MGAPRAPEPAPAFALFRMLDGSACGPVIVPVFKTGGRHLRDVVGVFDSHTLPPMFQGCRQRVPHPVGLQLAVRVG
jgi:hypothetical protein